jgi:hypothetical protein
VGGLSTPLLAQQSTGATETLAWWQTFIVVTVVIVAIGALVTLLRLASRFLRTTLGRWVQVEAARSTPQERRLLGALSVSMSVLVGTLAASTESYEYSNAAEQVIVALMLSSMIFAYVGPLLLLPSRAFRTALRVDIFRTSIAMKIPWWSWSPAQVLIALPLNVALVGPFVWPVVGTRTSIRFMRGAYDDGVDTKVEWPLEPDRASEGRAKAWSRPERPPQPPPAPSGPRRDAQTAPQRTGAPEQRPSGPAQQRAPERTSRSGSGGTARSDAEQPRRRWWQAVGTASTGSSTAKEPKFRTKSGGDGQTHLTARRRTATGEDGKSYDVVEIGIDASFRVPRSGSPVVQVLELFDVTESGRGPIAIHRWGEDELNTGGPYRTSSQSTVPHTSARLSKTVTIGLGGLHAPYRGDRTVHARFTMHRPRSPGQPIAQGWVEFPYREEVVGYIEAPQLRLRTEAGIVTAGFAAVVADGDVDPKELQLLEQFLAARHRRAPDGQKLADAARAALDEAKLRVRSGISARELLLQAGRDLAGADKGPRSTAYELAVRIMAVDKRITEDELARLNELAEILGIDAETAATLRNRHTDLGMFEGEDVDPLGVPEGTAAEQRAFLMGELRKWRSVLTHPDAAKRQQAQETMDLITARIAELDRSAAGTA